MAKKINWASAEHNKQDSSIVAGAQQKMLNQEQWSEDFQDLSGYCNIGSKMVDSLALQSGEQLNTPNITVQDGFDFGLRSSSGERFGPLEEPDPWGALPTTQSSPQVSTSQSKLWDSVTYWLSSSPIPDYDPDPQFDITQEEKPSLSTSDDYLLSQSPPEYSGGGGGVGGNLLRVPTIGQDYKEQSMDLVSLLDQTENNSINNSKSSLLIAPFVLSTPSINNIRITNNINNKSMESKNSSNNDNNIITSKSFPIKTSPQTLILQNQQKVKTELYSYDINKNRRDPMNNNHQLLSSIFKTEEPLIGERVKEQYSSSIFSESADRFLRIGEETKRSSPAVIIESKEIPDDILLQATTVQRMENLDQRRSATVEYIIPEVKSEPIDCEEMEVVNDNIKRPANNTSGGGIIRQQTFKVPSQMKKPALKLDIDSAVSLMASTNALQTAIAGDSLDTPDVLRPLLANCGEFDLISYCEEVDEAGNLFSTGSDSPIVVDIKKNVAVVKPVTRPSTLKRTYEKVMPDHEYTGKKEVEDDVEDDTVSMVLDTIKEEEEVVAEEEPSCSSTSSAPKRRRRSSTRKDAGKKRRLLMRSDDLDSECSLVSDYNDDENDETFQPPSSKQNSRRKRTTSKSMYPARNNSTSRRRISSSEIDSDQESISSSIDRYRELRDRNNEASRRSRMNRKSRESEMKSLAVRLEGENRALKKKADNMERLVKKLREGLMQLVLQNRR